MIQKYCFATQQTTNMKFPLFILFTAICIIDLFIFGIDITIFILACWVAAYVLGKYGYL